MNNIQIALNKAICKKMAQKKKEYNKTREARRYA